MLHSSSGTGIRPAIAERFQKEASMLRMLRSCVLTVSAARGVRGARELSHCSGSSRSIPMRMAPCSSS